MDDLKWDYLYRVISEFSNNYFRSDKYDLYSGVDTSYANEVIYHYK